jgi:hypothetical protein
MVKRFSMLVALIAASLTATPVRAEEPRDSEPSGLPRLHHAPPAVSAAHQDLVIEAEILYPEAVRRALVVYTTPDKKAFREVEFRRGLSAYVAVVPGAELKWPWLAYAIELELTDDRRLQVFGSRTHPHVVEVPEDRMDVRERALAERLRGRRSVFSTGGEYVDFGQSETDLPAPAGGFERRTVPDRYYRIEGAYTFRPLRFVTEFSLRIGVVRGESPVPIDRELEPGENPNERLKVGLNYGAPSVRVRFSDLVHADASFLTSVTEVGFSLGGGGAVIVGDPYGSRLTLGAESIEVFGTRFWSRMDVSAGARLVLAPIIEVTNMPHADSYGVRLLGELAFDMENGFVAAVRGGYQARRSTSGGPSAGATLSYAF